MYVPSFTCKYCGESKSAELTSEFAGMFVPCQCEEARKAQDQAHHLEVERRKKLRRRGKR